MIVLLAQYQAKAGMGDEVERLLTEMAALVKAHEPGCTMYQISRGREDKDAFLLYEKYVDETAVAAHRETPHFQQYVLDQIIPLLESREVAFYEVVIA